jgi:replicative DNA helicase
MSAPLLDRVPPQSLEAEQATLGAMLMEWDAIERAQDMLTAQDFYSPQHQILFKAVVDLHADGVGVDLVSLQNLLVKRGILDGVGGRSYLIALQDPAPTAAAVEHYAAIVKSKSLLRQMLGLCADNTRLIQESESYAEPAETLENIRASWLTLETALPDEGWQPIKPIFQETSDRLERQQAHPETVGMSTGLERLDNLTAGLHPGRLYVTAALRKHGKTTLLVNQLSHLAFREGIPCALFSFEMKAGALAEKIIAAEGGIDAFRLRTARIDGEEWHRLSNVIAAHGNAPLYISDRRGLSVQQIITKARQTVRRHGVKVIAIDYFQRIRRPQGAKDERIGFSDNVHALQDFAGNADVAVLLLSQLGRMVEGRRDKRPTLNDLMETSSLEQDADVVTLFYHRPDGDPSPSGNILELMVAANRYGPSGVAPVFWNPRFQQVRDLEPCQEAYEPTRRGKTPFWKEDD